MTTRSPQGAKVPSGSPRRHAFALASFALAVVAIGGGCSFGESGTAPPANRIFLPAGVVADPDGGFLYVVNSNSDLRYNAGTIVTVDLSKVAGAPRLLPRCPKTRFTRDEPVPGDFCCIDYDDSNIVNCNEPQFIQSNATVSIGSFGGAIQVQRYQRADGADVHRLFVAVRAEPSITFADVTLAADAQGAVSASVRCQGPQSEPVAQQPLAFCDDNWKVRRPGGATPGALVLPEEPHVMLLDSTLGALFVGHLTVLANGQIDGGGVSSIDVCDPTNVRFAGLAHKAFPSINFTLQSVAGLSSPPSIQNTTPPVRVYAGARSSAAMSALVLNSESTSCTAERDLTLVPAETFFSPAFLPHGADVRGILFSDDGTRAWILHKNDIEIPSSPAALVLVDRQRLDLTGQPANTPIDFVQVCNGPTEMQWHGQGAGKRIYITCYDDGRIYVVEPNSMTVTAKIDVGEGPTSLVFSPIDPTKAYVASFFNSHLSVIDVAPGSRTENRVILRVGLPHGYGQ